MGNIDVMLLQGAAGHQYFAGRQRWMQGGAEIPENPAGGGARTWSSFQALPAQHPLTVYGAGLPSGGRGQLVFMHFKKVTLIFLLLRFFFYCTERSDTGLRAIRPFSLIFL